jgi:hypothetical protein
MSDACYAEIAAVTPAHGLVVAAAVEPDAMLVMFEVAR